MRLGLRQLKLLMVLGAPDRALVVPDALSRSLMKHGFIAPRWPESDGFLGITPTGLRALADAMERGRLAPFLTKPGAEKAS